MLVFDNIKEIARHANYDTILTLLDCYPQIHYKHFWKDICAVQFPKQPYVHYLTGRENYLIKNKQFYSTFNIGAGQQGYSRHIYESSIVPNDCKKHLITFENRYAIKDEYGTNNIICYHDSIKSCLNWIHTSAIRNLVYTIIDLTLMTLVFNQYGTIKKESDFKFFKLVCIRNDNTLFTPGPDGWTSSTDQLF